VRPDEAAIDRGMQALEGRPIDAVLLGHSHFDHIADLPVVLRRHAPAAAVYLNRSGLAMLAGCPGLDNPWVMLDDREGRWLAVGGTGARPAPLRLMALPSEHAPHARGIHFAAGEARGTWRCIDGERLRRLREGRVHTFLVDLLSPEDGSVRFRIFLQDAASAAPHGFPPAEVLAEREVDVAVLCVPSWWLARDYPAAILAHLRPRHVVAVHYEDFLRPRTAPLRFAPTLTDGRANRFLELAREALAAVPGAPAGPDPCPCGPCGPAVSMPLPGEWLRFPLRADAPHPGISRRPA
jgi:hypothetical protein